MTLCQEKARGVKQEHVGIKSLASRASGKAQEEMKSVASRASRSVASRACWNVPGESSERGNKSLLECAKRKPRG